MLAQADVLYGRGFKNLAFSTAQKAIEALQENGMEPAVVMENPAQEINKKINNKTDQDIAYILRSVLIICRHLFEASEVIELGEFDHWINDISKDLPKGIDAENFNFLKAEEKETRIIISKAFLKGVEGFVSVGMSNLPWRQFSTNPFFRAIFNIDSPDEQFEISFPKSKLDANTVEKMTVLALFNAMKQEKKCILSIR
jgi:hypothetical protein